MRNLYDLLGGNPSSENINVVLFAGGGGADEGMKRAGLPVHVAINHDAEAIAMHKANFPECEHHIQDIWKVSPAYATRGRKVQVLWASPDCSHFSKAKGGKPRDQKIRDLAWGVIRWAEDARPQQIFLENVEEFQGWCDLIQARNKDGSLKYTKKGKPYMIPDKSKIDKKGFGNLFKQWRNALRKLGYKMEFRLLRACDFGAPTSRRRFFMIARCDGVKVRWPEPTHGHPDSPKVKSGELEPYRTAAECIKWDIPTKSIFERKKDLAYNTLRRIAAGVQKFVKNTENPFIVNLTHGGRLEGLQEPFKTITGAHRGEKAFVTPRIVNHGYKRQTCVSSTTTATLAPVERSTLTACAMLKHYTGVVGQDMRKPLGTVTSKDHHSPILVKLKPTQRAPESKSNPLMGGAWLETLVCPKAGL